MPTNYNSMRQSREYWCDRYCMRGNSVRVTILGWPRFISLCSGLRETEAGIYCLPYGVVDGRVCQTVRNTYFPLTADHVWFFYMQRDFASACQCSIERGPTVTSCCWSSSPGLRRRLWPTNLLHTVRLGDLKLFSTIIAERYCIIYRVGTCVGRR